MSIALTLQKYLADHNVAYDLLPHQPTMSSLRTAEAGHIPADRLAKGVVLRDKASYWLAVLPATRHIRLADLRSSLVRKWISPARRRSLRSSATVREAPSRPSANATGST